ncbi:MAG: lipid-binding SYLF domain-containing protein [Thermodesulfobacteriota bacterium]|jgi:lipid-binding SYLF domain-containing protein
MEAKGLRRFSTGFPLVIFVAALLISAPAPVFASDTVEAQEIVNQARATFKDFMADDNYSWLHEHLKDAKGLLIFPLVLKAGVFVGASGGNGVLLVKDPKTGEWSHPAFYTIGAVSFGLQVGIEGAEVVVLVMTQKAVASLLTSSFKLGGDISAAGGPQGVGVKSDVTAHFISFARAKGIFIGLDLEGSVISVREGLNQAYYGKEVTPEDIIVNNEVHNHRSIELRTALKNSAQ